MTPAETSSIKTLAKIIALAIYDKHKSLANETGKNFRKNTKPDLLSNRVDRILRNDLVSRKTS